MTFAVSLLPVVAIFAMPHRALALLLRAWVTAPLSHTPMMPPAMPSVVPLAAAETAPLL